MTRIANGTTLFKSFVKRFREQNHTIVAAISPSYAPKREILLPQKKMSELCQFSALASENDLAKLHKFYPFKDRNHLYKLLLKEQTRSLPVLEKCSLNMRLIEENLMKLNWTDLLLAQTQIPFTKEDLNELDQFYMSASKSGFTELLKQEYSIEKRSHLLENLQKIQNDYKDLKKIAEINEAAKCYNAIVDLAHYKGIEEIATKICFLNWHDHLFSSIKLEFSASEIVAQLENFKDSSYRPLMLFAFFVKINPAKIYETIEIFFNQFKVLIREHEEFTLIAKNVQLTQELVNFFYRNYDPLKMNHLAIYSEMIKKFPGDKNACY